MALTGCCIKWAGAEAHLSRFQAQWLRHACYSSDRRHERMLSRDASRTSWEGGGPDAGANTAFQPPSFSFADVMSEDNKTMWQAMRSLWRWGLLLVHDVPENFKEKTESKAESVSFCRCSP